MASISFGSKLKPTLLLLPLLLTAGTPLWAKVDFRKEILPVLSSKCLDCHKAPYSKGGRTVKPKAGLRLDAARAIIKGSMEGAVVFKGKPERSTLYTRVTLPTDHDDVMPPEGKAKPVTKREQAALKKWIEEGADFGGWIGDETGLPKVTASDKKQSTNELDRGTKALDDVQIQSIATAIGANIHPITTGSPLLRVEFPTESKTITDAKLAKLAPLTEQITELSLQRTGVTDRSMEMIGSLPKLTWLNLGQTKVTDTGVLKLQGSKHLSYLNLHKTKTSDKVLPTLAKLKKLEAIYFWGSKVTTDGVGKLRKALPDAKVHD